MTLIIILVCLALQKYLELRDKIHQFNFFDRYLAWITPILDKLGSNQGPAKLFGIMAPILIVITLLNFLFSHFWPLYFIYAVIVLTYCLNARDLKRQLSEYFYAYSSDNLDKLHELANQFSEMQVSRSKADISRAITNEIFLKSQTEVFSVLFWFMILGPFGAVLYHLTVVIKHKAERGEQDLEDCTIAATTLQNILDWLPIRLVTLTFALIGHFGPVINLWIEKLGAGLSENNALLVESGLTALDVNLVDTSHSDIVENNHALGLVNRALWTWIIVLAVLTVTAWIF